MKDSPRVLVTGGCGFVGSSVVRQLLRHGRAVTVLDDLSSGWTANLPLRAPDLKFCRGSINVHRDVRQALEGACWVIHLAARAFVPDSFQRPREVELINVTGSRILFEECEQAGVQRLVVASTAEIYGNQVKLPLTEEIKPAPVSPYGEGKLRMELEAQRAHREGGLEVTIVRLFNTYGPRATNPYVIPELIRQYVHGPVIKLGEMRAKRDFCSVADTARGIEAALISPNAGGETINLGSGHAISIAELAQSLACLGGINREVVLDPGRLRRREIYELVADASKAKELLSWEPKTPLAEGLSELLRLYYQEGPWPYEMSRSGNRLSVSRNSDRSMIAITAGGSSSGRL